MLKKIMSVVLCGMLAVACGEKATTQSLEKSQENATENVSTSTEKSTDAVAPAAEPETVSQEVSLLKQWVSDYPQSVNGSLNEAEVVIDLTHEGLLIDGCRVTDRVAKATGASTDVYYSYNIEGQAVKFVPKDATSGEILFPPYESSGGWTYSNLTATTVTISYEEGQVYEFKAVEKPVKMEQIPEDVEDFMMEAN